MKKRLMLLLSVCLSANVYAGGKMLDISDAEYLGAEIYKKDWLAWHATDDLLERNVLQSDARTKGWIVDTSTKPYAVHFMGPTDSGPKIFHSVYFDKEWKPSYKVGVKTEQYHQQMYSARKLALENLPLQCSSNYNTVVMPVKNGWIVYALAATTASGEVVIGGHTRFLINQEGSEILSSDKLYSACMNLNPFEGLGDGERPEGVYVTDKLNQHPSEAMVFLSIQHKLPIFVKTTSNGKLWKVNQGKIEASEEEPVTINDK